MTDNPNARLNRLGDALQAAATHELALADEHSSIRRRPARRGTRTKLIAALAAAALAVPAVALAANALTSNDEVARSLPNGVVALLGTEPTCTTVREGIEYECVLTKNPSNEIAPGEWKGTVEATVDDSNHVNGGCRAENGDGTQWRCYIGEEAVSQQIIGPALLGEYSRGPTVG